MRQLTGVEGDVRPSSTAWEAVCMRRRDSGVPVDVITETLIDRPPEQVAAYAGDPSNAPRWYLNIKSVEWKTPPPMRIGSRMAFVAQFLGRRLAYTYEVVDLVPGHRVVMKTARGAFPMETTYTWDPVGCTAGAHATRKPERPRPPQDAARTTRSRILKRPRSCDGSVGRQDRSF